jgi:glycosyltransferase involved in cell wall biosynthesis
VSSSKSLEQAFREDENFGVPIRQIYSGFRLPPYQQLPPNQTITFLGRLSYVKGVEFLIEAMREVSKSLPEARLILMGAGPDEIRLRRLVRDANLTDCVFFLGWIRNDEAIRQLGESRVVVIPSIWPENQPTTCIEAMGVGRPVIGTNVGGIPELIVDGKNGYIVPPADARALAQALTRILGDEGLCEAMSVDTRARVKQFGVSTFVRQMASLYEDTCSRASGPIFGRTRPVKAGRSSAPAWRRRSR